MAKRVSAKGVPTGVDPRPDKELMAATLAGDARRLRGDPQARRLAARRARAGVEIRSVEDLIPLADRVCALCEEIAAQIRDDLVPQLQALHDSISAGRRVTALPPGQGALRRLRRSPRF